MTEDSGIPDYADDASTAYDEADRPRLDDSPAALPGEEPQGVDEYGTSAAEQRHGEPLSARLVREEPDVTPDDTRTPDDPVLGDEAAGEALARAAQDADVPADGDSGYGSDGNGNGYGYGYGGNGYGGGDPVGASGRLVAPDLGVGEDTEGTAVAEDTGEVGEQTAEEAAMHEVPDDEVR